MKKLLIIAHDFPPYISVGGLRPYNWFRYLREFDIEPIVVTRQWSNRYGNDLDFVASGISDKVITEQNEFGTLILTPYKPNLSNLLLLKFGDKKFKFFRKTISGIYEYGQYILPIGPKINIYKAAKNYLKNNKVDAIIATADPFILFKFASKLSKKHQVPWIADYRDTWIQDNIRSKNWLQRKWNKFFENRYLKNASHITTISHFIENQLKTSIQSKQCTILMNGYDPYLLEGALIEKQDNKNFTISLAGRIYKYHPMDIFLRVCNEFYYTLAKKNFRLKFYGVNNQEVIQEIIRTKYSNLSDVVEFIAKIPNEDLGKELSKDNVFLLFNEYYIVGTKIFNYLALKRKILLCFSNDPEANRLKSRFYNFNDVDGNNSHAQEDIISETNSGIIVKNSWQLIDVLNDLYLEFEQNGEISCESHGIEKYSRKLQVQKLADLVHHKL